MLLRRIISVLCHAQEIALKKQVSLILKLEFLRVDHKQKHVKCCFDECSLNETGFYITDRTIDKSKA